MTRFIKLILIGLILTGFTTFDTSFAGTLGTAYPATDESTFVLMSPYDLRDRESYIQVTNITNSPTTVHIQIFTVNDNCRENNFFDNYTGNDTHVYNIRDIITNDSSPSGVVLDDGSYGMVVVTVVDAGGTINDDVDDIVGNIRIVDNSGFEYRTNSSGVFIGESITGGLLNVQGTLNYNTQGGINLSDIFFLNIANLGVNGSSPEVTADPVETYWTIDIDIYNENEVPFSCRNVIGACIDQESPRLEELLEDSGAASVASFEYGINDAIPSSKGAPLLCPNNIINNGFILLTPINEGTVDVATVFIGLNNGNGRGSLDSVWISSLLLDR